MIKYRLRILVGLALSGLAAAEIAPVPGSQSIRPLFERADLVCSCSVRSVETLGPKNSLGDSGSQSALAVVEVEDIYKSVGSNMVSVTVQCEEGQLRKGERAILFLKSTAPSVYELADPFIGETPFTSIPRGSSTEPGLPKLEMALAELTQRSDRDDQINAMKLLQGFDSLDVVTISRLIPLSNSKDHEIAIPALAVLLNSKTPEDVARVREYFAGYPSDAGPVAILSIGTELSQIQDKRALRDLEVLSGSKLLSVRIGSMQALRAMRNPKSARTFISRLDDLNGYVRYLAVISLAETFGKYGDYAPNMQLFDRNSDFYVGLWKAWWNEEGRVAQSNSTPQ